MRLRTWLLAAALLALPSVARATSCAETPIRTIAPRVDAIFLAVVEGIRPSLTHPFSRFVMRVRVLRAWKGVEQDRVELVCGELHASLETLRYAVRGESGRGDTLLVVAKRIDGTLMTGICGLTGGSLAAEYTAELGPGTVPAATAPAVHAGPRWRWPAAVGLLVLVAMGLWRIMRRHP